MYLFFIPKITIRNFKNINYNFIYFFKILSICLFFQHAKKNNFNFEKIILCIFKNIILFKTFIEHQRFILYKKIVLLINFKFYSDLNESYLLSIYLFHF